ncbi:MAG: xylulokinase [Defluviitaleaceae bacterium]|nr:xylulokinase [Defluviitaleaceae bacterium]
MGIDLGTSSLKVVVIDENGILRGFGAESYAIHTPKPGFAEQDPHIWWDACCNAIRQCFSGDINGKDITAISFSGQMHGTVMLGSAGEVLGNAIIHCDGRSVEQVTAIEAILGREYIVNHVLNPIFPGFQIPTLLWLKENESETFAQIKTVLSPKDYLRFRLTGDIITENSDASATLAYDIRSGKLNISLLDMVNLPADIFPKSIESTTYAGYITKDAAATTGLSPGTPVIAGGSDQVMQAIGNGVLSPGDATITIGTGGQVLFPTEVPIINPQLNTHTFSGARPGTWYVMGAMLSAGACLNWLRKIMFDNQLSYIDMDSLAENAPAGSGGLMFLPSMRGERTPYLNPGLKGMFFGLSPEMDRGTLVRAVMEGVAFGMNECLQTCISLGPTPNRVIASGGATRSKLWLQIQADIYGQPLYLNNVTEHAAVGAAIVAGVGLGLYKDFQVGCSTAVKPAGEPVLPNMDNYMFYQERFQLFRQLYNSNMVNFERGT